MVFAFFGLPFFVLRKLPDSRPGIFGQFPTQKCPPNRWLGSEEPKAGHLFNLSIPSRSFMTSSSFFGRTRSLCKVTFQVALAGDSTRVALGKKMEEKPPNWTTATENIPQARSFYEVIFPQTRSFHTPKPWVVSSFLLGPPDFLPPLSGSSSARRRSRTMASTRLRGIGLGPSEPREVRPVPLERSPNLRHIDPGGGFIELPESLGMVVNGSTQPCFVFFAAPC